MNLIVEDGNLIYGANSFSSVEDADAYCQERGLKWDGDEDAKAHALIRATHYLNTLSWKGEKVNWSWPVCFPRKGITIGGQTVPKTVVPEVVKQACIEMAVLCMGGTDPLAPQERGNGIQSETVGPISISYFDDASNETFFPAVVGLLKDFLRTIPGKAGNSFTVNTVVAR